MYGSPQLLLDTIQGKISSEKVSDLTVAATRSWSDAYFGDFSYDASLDFLEVTKDWLGVLVKLQIPTRSDVGFRECLKNAKAVWDKPDYWSQLFHASIVDDLLELKNSSWNDSSEPISEDEFVSRLQLRSILVRENGAFEVCYDDGQLFGGHEIVLDGFLDDGISNVALHG